jgi:MYXO-CTERM domain-containing protein
MRLANLWLLGLVAVFTGSFLAPAHAQECTSNADCAAPLTCKAGASSCSQGGAFLPDGGVYVSDPVCTPGPSKCTWSFVPCQADSECTFAQWACLLVPDQTVIKTCFPKAIACSAGQACPAGWSCLDLSQWKDGDEPLDIWNIKSGTQFCWPDSLKAVLDRSARTDGSGLNLPSSGDSASGDGDSVGTSGAAGAPGSTKADSTSSSKGSGCTMASQAAPTHFGMLTIAVLGLLWFGRKRRRR